MGAKPPMVNPEMESQSDWSTARSGSMPMSRHSTVTMVVAIRMMATAIFEMNCVVCTTLGTTCSLRPSDMYRLGTGALAEQPERQSHHDKSKPPIKCIMNRNMLSAYDR